MLHRLIRIQKWLLLLGLCIRLAKPTQAQIQLTFDSIAGMKWNDMSLVHAQELFTEVAHVSQGPSGHAMLLGGGCIRIPGWVFVSFPQTGVRLTFTPPDSLGQHQLKSAMAWKRGAVRTPRMVDTGDRIDARANSDGTPTRQLLSHGRKYILLFDKGITYFCRPASFKRAKSGKPLRVERIVVREHF